MKKLILFIFLAGLAPLIQANESDPRVKVLLEEALRLYSERQYVRSLDLFKQVQRIDPSNKTAAEYIQNSEERISEWEEKGGDGRKKEPTWESLLKERKKGGDKGPNANDIIAARRSLVERMRNRSTNTDNIVQIQDSKGRLQVTLFHDQLFLPGLQTLRDEALPILENVAQLIREKGDRDVSVTSKAHNDSNDPYLLFPEVNPRLEDATLPQMKQAGGSSVMYKDIEATRSIILFTYLAQRSMTPQKSIEN